ncbi:mitochondrial escape protein 2 [Savitreella phatthalungensis]
MALRQTSSYQPLQRSFNRASGSPALSQPRSRCASSTIRQSVFGHMRPCIACEGLFYFDNIYPLRFSVFDIRYWIRRLDPSAGNRIISQAIPADLNLSIAQLYPQPREGGLFARLSWSDESLTSRAVLAAIDEHLQKSPIRPGFNPFASVRIFPVNGQPWLEDMRRFPSPRIRIDYDGPAPKEERLFELFRPFGNIRDIITSDKTSPVILFSRVRSATSARACMHGYQDGATLLRIVFIRKLRKQAILDWLSGHLRIVLPILAALIAGISVSVFEPIRSWFIQQKISRSFHYEDSRVVQWLVSGARGLLDIHGAAATSAGVRGTWFERETTKAQLATWLADGTSNFIVVHGPDGTGKREMVEDTLRGRSNVLYMDCRALVNARGDAATISELASQLGYRPIFSWMNSISSLVDLAAQGLVGASTGFSETLDTQMKAIFATSASAMRSVSLRGRKAQKPQPRDEEYLEAHPETRVILVVDNFLYKAKQSMIIYDNIVRWAALLTQSRAAHVIFVTSDPVTWQRLLSKELPTRTIRSLPLADAEPEMAVDYVCQNVKTQKVFQGFPEDHSGRADRSVILRQVEILGGRLDNLDLLSRRLSNGENADEATNEILRQTSEEIVKLYFASNEDDGWTRVQAWAVLKALGSARQNPDVHHSAPGIRFQRLILDPVLGANGGTILRKLEEAQMISISSENGCPAYVRAGKPVYDAAFRRLQEDVIFCASLEMQYLAILLSQETETIAKCENELALLKPMVNNIQVRSRVQHLLDKLERSQASITRLEAASKAEKSVLMTA